MIFILISLGGLNKSYSQELLYQEDFNSCAKPTGWTVLVEGVDPGPAAHYFGTIQNDKADGSSIDGTCMAIVDDDIAGENTPAFKWNLISPTLPDPGTYTSLIMSVDVHFRFSEQGEKFGIFVYDGSRYLPLKIYQRWGDHTGEQFSQFETFTADLSYFANPDLHVVFRYDDGGGWGWWAGIDNFRITGSGQGKNIVAQAFNACEKPADWSTEIVKGIDDYKFGIIDYNGNAWASPTMDGSCFVFFDDDGLGQDAPKSIVRLKTPVFDGTEFARYTLEMDLILRKYAALEGLTILVYDGSKYRPVNTYLTDYGGPQFNEYQHLTLDLSKFRSPSMQVVFEFSDGNDWGWWVGMDNIKIIGAGNINDQCDKAITLQAGNPCIAGDNTTALFTGEAMDCNAGDIGSLWYQYTAPEKGFIRLQSGSNFNEVLSYFGGSCQNLTPLKCVDRDEYGFTSESPVLAVEAGQSVWLRLSGKPGRFADGDGELCVALSQVNGPPQSPAHEHCGQAIAIPFDQACSTRSHNLEASTEAPVPSRNARSRANVWYRFQVPAGTEAVQILSNSDFAEVMTLFSGPCDQLEEIAVSDYGYELLTEGLSANTTYYLQVSGYFSTVEGSLCPEIHPRTIPTVPNDICAEAPLLTIGGACLDGSNIGAQSEGVISSCNYYNSADVWYRFTAPASGSVRLHNTADFVYNASIYSGPCENLEEAACLKELSACKADPILAGLVAGQTYYLRIGSTLQGSGAQQGNFCISLIDGSLPYTHSPLHLEVNIACEDIIFGRIEAAGSGGLAPYTYTLSSDGLMAYGQEYTVVVRDANGCETFVSGTVACGPPDCSNSDLVAEIEVHCLKNELGVNTGYASADLVASSSSGISQVLGFSEGSTYAHGDQIQAFVADHSGCLKTAEATVQCPAFTCAESDLQVAVMYTCNDSLLQAQLQVSTQGGLGDIILGGNANGEWLSGNQSYEVTATDAFGCVQIAAGNIQCVFDTCALSTLSGEVIVECLKDNSGNNTGEATLSVNISGGFPPYDVQGNPPTIFDGDTYALVLVDAYGCQSEINGTVECQTTGLEILRSALLKVYPVPAQDLVFIQYLLPTASAQRIELLDAKGQLLRSFERSGTSGENQLKIDLNGLAPGLYQVSIRSADGVIPCRIIKQ